MRASHPNPWGFSPRRRRFVETSTAVCHGRAPRGVHARTTSRVAQRIRTRRRCRGGDGSTARGRGFRIAPRRRGGRLTRGHSVGTAVANRVTARPQTHISSETPRARGDQRHCPGGTRNEGGGCPRVVDDDRARRLAVAAGAERHRLCRARDRSSFRTRALDRSVGRRRDTSAHQRRRQQRLG